MSTKTVENFFTGRTLIIPEYQRDYAWTESNVDDLFGDVEEALEANSGHYLGTFILSQSESNEPAHVVDGQQRLTTLTMLLDALTKQIEDKNISQHYKNSFIEHPVTGLKLRMQGDNDVFFRSLLTDNAPVPKSDGQERLSQAYYWIRQRVHALTQRGGQKLLTQWLTCVSQMEVLEFVERNQGKAIRMFQSVNDRGVPLAKMDIIKSLLIYYSNRYLDGQLDTTISKLFGNSFRHFSRIKRLAGGSNGYQVRLIARDAFREDDLLRFHYLSYDGSDFDLNSGADYNATAETVLESFLKPALKKIRSDNEKLKKFIIHYTADLEKFFGGLESLIESMGTDHDIYRLFAIQDLSATLYPLIIRLHLINWLNRYESTADTRNLLNIVGMVDLRVFKLRNTNPQADIAAITSDLPKLKISEVIGRLRHFSQKFMADPLLISRVSGQDLYRNPGLPIMLLEAEDRAREAIGLSPISLEDLVQMNASGLTIEHILPQDPSFNVGGYGFENTEDYQQRVHRIGNLILLESTINSRCRNRTVEAKMSNPSLYQESDMKAVASLRAEFANKAPMFSSDAIDSRSKTLADMIIDRWPSVGL